MTMPFIVLVGWVLIGIVAGAIACPRHPGPDSTGWTGTVLVGIMGSLSHGGAAYLLGFGVSPTQGEGWIMSIVGLSPFSPSQPLRVVL